MTLARPDYIELDANGRMVTLYCAVCGTKIGEDRRGNFYRFHNYAELKMKFSDGAMHVTNLCTGCVGAVAASRSLMFEVYQADIDEMVRSLPSMNVLRFKFSPEFVKLDVTRSGML